MKAHTSNFKDSIKQFGKQIDCKINYYIDGEMIELGSEELNSITPTFEGSILKSVMKQLDIVSNIKIPVGTIINCKFGLSVNEEYEYINYGDYIVQNVEEQKDTNSYKMICYDYMLRSMVDYNKLQTGKFPMTIHDYIKYLCEDIGLEFANENTTFVNYDKVISSDLYEDLGYTYRTIFDEIAQVTASTICINNNNKLEIRYINETNDTIDEEYLKNINVNFGEKYGPINSIVLSRSGESDNVYLQDEQSIEDNGLCEVKIIDNQIMNFNDRSDYLPDILYQLNGLEYYLNDYSSPGICYYDLCDRYNVQIGDNIYSCIMFNDEVNIDQGLEENVYTDMPEETETDYKTADKTDMKINRTYLIVDKQNQQIEGVIETTSEQNEKIAKITATVDELNSKISDIADITVSKETTFAKLNMERINKSEPILVKIRPLGNNIDYLYPNNNLYPNDSLYPKNRYLLFHNISTNEEFYYEIPSGLLYLNSRIYDEFYLSYDNQLCYITKRCGYDENGNIVQLESEETVEFDYPKIELTDGDYEISLLGYETGYLDITLMAQNIYTTQFATKAEVNSEIKQTAQEIDLSVNKKLTNYSTTTEMNSAIILKANEINQEVRQKVGKNEVVSSINNAIVNGQGVIDLKSNSVIIDSDNFALDKNGNITKCNNINITGGQLQISKSNGTIYVAKGTDGLIRMDLTSGGNNYQSLFNANGLQYNVNNQRKILIRALTKPYIYITNSNGSDVVRMGEISSGNASGGLQLFNSSGTRTINITGEYGQVWCTDLYCTGTKNRVVKINNGDYVKLNAYETATPYFGDIGSNKTDENGICKIYIEDIFKQTIELDDYKVFIQECGEGNLYVKKHKEYFEIKGTPNLEFDWELKSIQKGFANKRLEIANFNKESE